MPFVMFPIVFDSNHQQTTQNWTFLIKAFLLAMTDIFSCWNTLYLVLFGPCCFWVSHKSYRRRFTPLYF